ncbi:MAG: monovalent cation:proton antiporter-2 (CPA2) family protein, partial [Planctomycetota bacterium]
MIAAVVAGGGAAGALQSAFVYLAAAVLMVPVAKRLGLGSVLGYLVAGVLIGPAALDLVGDAAQVMGFAEFGVVVMLFLIGLELQPRVLWTMRKDVLGLGGLQVAVTAGLVFGIATALGLAWREAVAVGLILALSSTAIALQSLAEKGLSDAPAGRRSFAVLLFQDIAVIPILALLPLLATASGDGAEAAAESAISGLPAYQQALAVLGAIALVIAGGKLLIGPMLRVIAATHLRELFVAAALLIVVGISLAMGLVGLSPALGTFLAGVVLADSEYRHELEGDLEPFKGLLLGLFFITVGASIDFGLVADMPLAIVGLVLGLMALKALVLQGLGLAWGVRAPARATLSLILAQAGEFGFVLVATSLSLGIFAGETGQLLVVVIALSMALTPLALVFDDRVLQPRLARVENECMGEAEAPPAGRRAPVLVAGFRRYGQTAGRLLMANGFDVTVLDLDPSVVSVLRDHGLPVYFGDATRAELLESAGAEHVEVLVVATSEPARSLEIVESVRRHFPKIRVSYARLTMRIFG